MDALALLCTLHADGPATLKRLRRAQCATLEALLSFDVERLARMLDTSHATAQRFQREARSLASRLGVAGGLLEREAPTARRAPSADEKKRRAIDRVLSTWRERDEESGAAGSGDAVHEAGLAPLEMAESASLALPASPAAIEPDAVDGLDGDAAVALARAGVHDLAALAACDALAIARQSGLAYTRVLRWRSLARRIALEPRAVVEVARTQQITVAPRAQRIPPSEETEKFSFSELQLQPAVPLVRFDEADVVLTPVRQREPETAGGPFA